MSYYFPHHGPYAPPGQHRVRFGQELTDFQQMAEQIKAQARETGTINQDNAQSLYDAALQQRGITVTDAARLPPITPGPPQGQAPPYQDPNAPGTRIPGGTPSTIPTWAYVAGGAAILGGAYLLLRKKGRR